MEILQIVAGSLPARPLVQDFVVRVIVAAPMDLGKILKKKPRAVKHCQQRSVMIGGKRVKTGLDIGEVLLEKDGHIRVEASAVWHGALVWARGRAFLPSRRRTSSDSRRRARLCPTYQAMRGSWLAP